MVRASAAVHKCTPFFSCSDGLVPHYHDQFRPCNRTGQQYQPQQLRPQSPPPPPPPQQHSRAPGSPTPAALSGLALPLPPPPRPLQQQQHHQRAGAVYPPAPAAASPPQEKSIDTLVAEFLASGSAATPPPEPAGDTVALGEPDGWVAALGQLARRRAWRKLVEIAGTMLVAHRGGGAPGLTAEQVSCFVLLLLLVFFFGPDGRAGEL